MAPSSFVGPASSSSQWKVAPRDLYGCELFLGKVDKDGYGRIFNGPGRPSLAHRAIYEERHGPIPEGKEVEHRCRRRGCQADDHHVLVSRAENERLKRWRKRTAEKACPRGHDLSVNGAITPEGGRVCRACARASNPTRYTPATTGG